MNLDNNEPVTPSRLLPIPTLATDVLLTDIELAFDSLVKKIEALKPNDRSKLDRHCAIVLTELEKIQAYIAYYVS